MLAPILCLHVPQSCAHGVSPCGMVYQQTARAAFLHAGTGNFTSYCTIVRCQQLHAHAARPDAIIYPMGLAKEENKEEWSIL